MLSAERSRTSVEALSRLLAGRDVPSLGDYELIRAGELVGEARRALDAIAVHAAAEVEERMLHVQRAERTAADAMAACAGIGVDEARAWCTVGRAIRPRVAVSGEVLEPERPVLADAILTGSVGVPDAVTILNALDRVKPVAGGVELLDVERFLVEHAPGMSRRDVERMARRTIDVLDPDGAEPREDLLRARSGVRVHRTPDGLVRWIVTMHPEAAGFLTTAVDARTAPRREPRFTLDPDPADSAGPAGPAGPAEQDLRPLAQRRLDALIGIARESMQHDPGSVAGAPVTMLLTMTLDELRSGVGTARIAGVDEPVSAATARRLACDAELIPQVLGSSSETLDQGRAVRLFTTAQRRALATRDGGCVWPGCHAPPSWCEVAHRHAWLDGGPTDLHNGALVCTFHHRRLDTDGWELRWRDHVLHLIPPATVDPRRRPRRAGRLPEYRRPPEHARAPMRS